MTVTLKKKEEVEMGKEINDQRCARYMAPRRRNFVKAAGAGDTLAVTIITLIKNVIKNIRRHQVEFKMFGCSRVAPTLSDGGGGVNCRAAIRR